MISDSVSNRIVVFSGKGGVGKTTVSVNLACMFGQRSSKVGLLDADITGPNVLQMLGIDEQPRTKAEKLLPHERHGIRVVSLASLMPADAAVIWRGPMRSKALEQLLNDTEWGDMDTLIVDLPPGTGDEALTIAQQVAPQLAIVVTTPQEVALLDARRAINFARKLEIPTIAIVENMSGLICPHCGGDVGLFGTGGGQREAVDQGIPFLGKIPMDPAAREAGDSGEPIVLVSSTSSVSEAFRRIAAAVERLLGPRGGADEDDKALEKWIEAYTQSAFSSTVVEEATSPKNMCRLAEPDACGLVHGWCGDTMEIYLRLVGERIEVATFMTNGCGPTIACGSMLTKIIANLSIEEALAITPAQLINALGGLPSESAHCAELAVRTARQAIGSLAAPTDKLGE